MIFERGSPISFIYDSEHPVTKIEGKWEIRDENELMLSEVKTDYGEMPYVKLELFHTAPSEVFVSGAGDAELLFKVDPDAAQF